MPVRLQNLVKVTRQCARVEHACPGALRALQRVVDKATRNGAPTRQPPNIDGLLESHPALRRDLTQLLDAAFDSFRKSQAYAPWRREFAAYSERAAQADPPFDTNGAGAKAAERNLRIRRALMGGRFEDAGTLLKKSRRGAVVRHEAFVELVLHGPPHVIRAALPWVDAPGAALRSLALLGGLRMLKDMDDVAPTDVTLDLHAYREIAAKLITDDPRDFAPGFRRLSPEDQSAELSHLFQNNRAATLEALLPHVKPGAALAAKDFLWTTEMFDVDARLGALGYRLLASTDRPDTFKTLMDGDDRQRAVASMLSSVHANIA